MQTTDGYDLAGAWSEAHVRPLWQMPLAPIGANAAHLWEWRTLEPLVREALDITSPSAVERRVLSLVGPGAVGDEFHTTTNINAGLQILKPGESARPHRHSMNALRFIIKGTGATTTVNGKVCTMDEGDLLITLGRAWHEHQHLGDTPIVWLDVLDVALHLYFGTDRFEPGPARDVPQQANAVAFHYPLADAIAAVRNAPRTPDGTRRFRYINPGTGGTVMPALDSYLVALDPNVDTVPFRTTANAVCAVVSGSGSTKAGNSQFSWQQWDVFSLPHGQWVEHRAQGEDTFLFLVTDRDIYRRLEILTEEYNTGA